MSSPCPQKDVCGSCSWSHIPYDKQLIQKLSDINGSLKLKGLSQVCDQILPAPTTEHYRNRMDFVINFEGLVGMRQKDKWWRVLDNHTCFLADVQIDRLFQEVRTWVQSAGISFYDRRAHTGLLRYAVIRATRTGETMLTLVTSTPKAEEKESLHTALVAMAEASSATTVIWSINETESDTSFGTILETLKGEGVIQEEIGGYKYRISPNAFFQTNSFASHLLLKTVARACGDLTDKRLLDLYCGTGFFSIALAKFAKSVIGVELNAEAIEDAKKNAVLNNVSPEFIAAPTEDYDWSQHEADIVILDPPRSGMHDRALADVIKHLPETIVYVSCNPKNFARELVILQEFYAVESMCAIDLFPHTPHVELVTKLTRLTR